MSAHIVRQARPHCRRFLDEQPSGSPRVSGLVPHDILSKGTSRDGKLTCAWCGRPIDTWVLVFEARPALQSRVAKDFNNRKAPSFNLLRAGRQLPAPARSRGYLELGPPKSTVAGRAGVLWDCRGVGFNWVLKYLGRLTQRHVSHRFAMPANLNIIFPPSLNVFPTLVDPTVTPIAIPHPTSHCLEISETRNTPSPFTLAHINPAKRTTKQ